MAALAAEVRGLKGTFAGIRTLGDAAEQALRVHVDGQGIVPLRREE